MQAVLFQLTGQHRFF